MVNNEKVEKFSFKDSDTTNKISSELEQKEYHVTSVTSQKEIEIPMLHLLHPHYNKAPAQI